MKRAISLKNRRDIILNVFTTHLFFPRKYLRDLIVLKGYYENENRIYETYTRVII